MLIRKIKQLRSFAATKSGRVRLGAFCAVMLACAFFSLLVCRAENLIYSEYMQTEVLPQDFSAYEVIPGGTVTQNFTSRGQSSGYCWEIYLNVLRAENSQGNVTVQIRDLGSGELVTCIQSDHSQIAGCPDLEAALQEAALLQQTRSNDRPKWEAINPQLTTHTVFSAQEEFRLYSGRKYALEIINASETDSIYLLGNHMVQSGKLFVDEEQQQGFLNLCFMRKPDYAPSKLVLIMLLLTNLTVASGLALVLFTDVKEHMLYLVLAIGFGIVTLFDLTPLYGFDMAFQFDSTYIASNKMMGLDGSVYRQSLKDPEKVTVFYYRRACDDYSQYQFYYHDEVSANYTDLLADFRNPFASEEDQELVLVESDRGYYNSSKYLFLPQSVGFTIARLLGLGFFPMLQLARACMYAVFVTVMFFAIRAIPFGKRIFLIWALVPTVLIQTISLTYDAMIICMSFFVIAKVIQLAYADRKPKILDWLVLLTVSAMLLPCKWVYIPVSCSFFLVLYRQYFVPSGDKWKPIALKFAVFLLLAVGVAVAVKWHTVVQLYREMFLYGNESLAGTESYTIPGMLADPVWTIFVFANTIRNQLGSYLTNAVQLFDIRLGASDGMTLIVFTLLTMECCSVSKERHSLRAVERCFMLLVALGVFLLVALASFRWTPSYSNVIEGLQGRYLTPVLPFVCLACHNNRLVRLEGKTDLLVKCGCCIFPAIFLMNMYLWTIGG